MTHPPRQDVGDARPRGAHEASRLRRASLADGGRLGDLHRLARPETPEAPAAMLDWLERGGALLLEDEEGRVLCALRWREEGDGWRVDRVATLPQARGRGFGRWLMTKVEALAIRNNIPSLSLTLEGGDLLAYYRRLGYRTTGRDGERYHLRKHVGGTWQTQEAARESEQGESGQGESGQGESGQGESGQGADGDR